MTIEDLKSWIKVINGLYFATCFICIGGFSYGFVPFSNKDTTINFCVALFFYAISILIIGNFIDLADVKNNISFFICDFF